MPHWPYHPVQPHQQPLPPCEKCKAPNSACFTGLCLVCSVEESVWHWGLFQVAEALFWVCRGIGQPYLCDDCAAYRVDEDGINRHAKLVTEWYYWHDEAQKRIAKGVRTLNGWSGE